MNNQEAEELAEEALTILGDYGDYEYVGVTNIKVGLDDDGLYVTCNGEKHNGLNRDNAKKYIIEKLTA